MELEAILLLVEKFATALPQIEALWAAISDDFSLDDQATIERAIAGKKDAAEAAIAKLDADVQD